MSQNIKINYARKMKSLYIDRILNTVFFWLGSTLETMIKYTDQYAKG